MIGGRILAECDIEICKNKLVLKKNILLLLIPYPPFSLANPLASTYKPCLLCSIVHCLTNTIPASASSYNQLFYYSFPFVFPSFFMSFILLVWLNPPKVHQPLFEHSTFLSFFSKLHKGTKPLL
ncbi:hypothetical protein J1N35_039441 [Gossypium stocksii]|uniref:Uncharacterized protein n=1 Tax=Gossypium stocksii TaxID=47602 RepID=A0A9D3UNT5_9ROSI|nr:hypothetical protein J1N35_039441 [Gossypium stocksii]